MTTGDAAATWRSDAGSQRAHGWQWRNVPLPEAHLGIGALAFALSIVRPRRLTWRWATFAGWPLIVGGLALAIVATSAAGQTDLEAPDEIVTHGPYAWSRNPMYVAWTAIYVGTALVARAAWLLVLTPLLAGLVHRDVRREEDRLMDAFGPAYAAYRRQVARYI